MLWRPCWLCTNRCPRLRWRSRLTQRVEHPDIYDLRGGGDARVGPVGHVVVSGGDGRHVSAVPVRVVRPSLAREIDARHDPVGVKRVMSRIDARIKYGDADVLAVYRACGVVPRLLAMAAPVVVSRWPDTTVGLSSDM